MRAIQMSYSKSILALTSLLFASFLIIFIFSDNSKIDGTDLEMSSIFEPNIYQILNPSKNIVVVSSAVLGYYKYKGSVFVLRQKMNYYDCEGGAATYTIESDFEVYEIVNGSINIIEMPFSGEINRLPEQVKIHLIELQKKALPEQGLLGCIPINKPSTVRNQ